MGIFVLESARFLRACKPGFHSYMDSTTGVKGWASWVLGVKGWAYRVAGGQGVGLQGQGGPGVGLQGPKRSRGRGRTNRGIPLGAGGPKNTLIMKSSKSDSVQFLPSL